MEEDEDDLYGQQAAPRQNGDASFASRQAPDLEEEGEEIEEDSDSDIDIITERKPTSTKPETASQSLPTRLEAPKPEHTRSASAATDKPATASTQQPAQSSTPQPQTHQRYSAPQSSKPGTDYPAIHTSTLDINGPDPTYDPAGKPLTDLDFDVDLAEHTKPWRLPGTDQTDYFNYGFDEFTWATYCLKQKSVRDAIVEQKAESAKFELMFGGGAGMPGMPGQPAGPQQGQAQQPQAQQGQPGQQGQQGVQQQVPAAMPSQGMPGMPSMPPMPGMPEMSPEMMNQMMQQMMASGVDPAQMDFGTFMQQFQTMQQGGGPAMGGPGGMGMPPQGPQQQQQHGYGGQGQGYGGGGGGGGGGGQRRGQGRRW